MPTYEYECAKCKKPFEMFQSMRDEPLKKCPQCGGKVQRLIGTGAGFICKGGGFYQTDYRSSAYQSSAKADSAASTSASASSSTSTPAASTTPAPAAPAAKTGGDAKSSSSSGTGSKKK